MRPRYGQIFTVLGSDEHLFDFFVIGNVGGKKITTVLLLAQILGIGGRKSIGLYIEILIPRAEVKFKTPCAPRQVIDQLAQVHRRNVSCT